MGSLNQNLQANIMKNYLLSIVFIFSIFPVFAQNAADEKEVRKLNESFDEAIKNADVTFYERVLASDYVSYGPDGSIKTKDQVLEEVKKQKENPSFRMSEISSDNVKVKLSGNLAVVTAQWNATIQDLESNEPHEDEGSYIAVYEKREGRWQLISEMGSEKPHSPEDLEASVREASNKYDEAIKSRDKDAYSKLLADDYKATNPMGKVQSKEESMKFMFDPALKLETSTVTNKEFQVFRNFAVETGEYNVTGTYQDEKFTESGRYTSTWRYKDGKWQIVADHTSEIKKEN